ncbi:MAG: protease inhibitor I42 family protein [Candidatus Omnitrophica bacterium]|nr:protease inhibitor I42 family protein [Candidatus Omnitrophota bacterium]
MRVHLSVFAVVVSAAVIAGCAQPGSREAKKLIERDSGKTIEMRTGNSILIELPGNPTTGYTWEVSSVDPSILHKLGDFKFSTNSNVIGSPGKMALRFRVVGEGRTTLALAYRRSWEKNVAPIKTFSVNVIAVK